MKVIIWIFLFVVNAFSAIFCCINTAQYRPETNNIGDIIGTFESNHPFSTTEKAAFMFRDVEGTREEVEALLQANDLEEKEVYKDVDNKWKNIVGKTDEELKDKEKITVWKDVDNKWYKLIKRPKYRYSLNGLTNDDLYGLKSKDYIIKLNSIKKIKKVVKEKEENKTQEIIIESITTP